MGLCIILHDIIHVGDSYIFPGDGASHTKGNGQRSGLHFHHIVKSVQFRFVVFRPFIDEILVGKIRSCSSEGVRGNHTST